MGLLGKLKKKVSKAVKKVAKKVADTIESGGNKAAEAANAIGDAVDNVPIVGGAIGAAARWAGRVTSAVCDVGAAVVNGVGAAIAGTAELIIGGIGGLVTGDWGLAKESLIGFASNLLGGALIIVGSVVGLVQTVFGIQNRKVKLTRDELSILRLVFQESLETKNIRIIKGLSGSGVYKFTDRPFTMGNIIYMKNTPAQSWNPTLVHEAVHVWQYQHDGPRYSADALGAALILGKERSYQWWKETPPWTAFNAESQAEMFEHMYEEGELQQPAGSWATPLVDNGCFFRGDDVTLNRFRCSHAGKPAPDYTQLANESTDYVRDPPDE